MNTVSGHVAVSDRVLLAQDSGNIDTSESYGEAHIWVEGN